MVRLIDKVKRVFNNYKERNKLKRIINKISKEFVFNHSRYHLNLFHFGNFFRVYEDDEIFEPIFDLYLKKEINIINYDFRDPEPEGRLSGETLTDKITNVLNKRPRILKGDSCTYFYLKYT